MGKPLKHMFQIVGTHLKKKSKLMFALLACSFYKSILRTIMQAKRNIQNI